MTQILSSPPMTALAKWLGFPDGPWRDWLAGAGYTALFLALFFVGGGH